jgi:hypothetical protein
MKEEGHDSLMISSFCGNDGKMGSLQIDSQRFIELAE